MEKDRFDALAPTHFLTHKRGQHSSSVLVSVRSRRFVPVEVDPETPAPVVTFRLPTAWLAVREDLCCR